MIFDWIKRTIAARKKAAEEQRELDGYQWVILSMAKRQFDESFRELEAHVESARYAGDYDHFDRGVERAIVECKHYTEKWK